MQLVLSLPNSRSQVVDVETGEALGHGQDGEICVKGPTVMKGKNSQLLLRENRSKRVKRECDGDSTPVGVDAC